MYGIAKNVLVYTTRLMPPGAYIVNAVVTSSLYDSPRTYGLRKQFFVNQIDTCPSLENTCTVGCVQSIQSMWQDESSDTSDAQLNLFQSLSTLNVLDVLMCMPRIINAQLDQAVIPFVSTLLDRIQSALSQSVFPIVADPQLTFRYLAIGVKYIALRSLSGVNATLSSSSAFERIQSLSFLLSQPNLTLGGATSRENILPRMNLLNTFASFFPPTNLNATQTVPSNAFTSGASIIFALVRTAQLFQNRIAPVDNSTIRFVVEENMSQDIERAVLYIQYISSSMNSTVVTLNEPDGIFNVDMNLEPSLLTFEGAWVYVMRVANRFLPRDPGSDFIRTVNNNRENNGELGMGASVAMPLYVLGAYTLVQDVPTEIALSSIAITAPYIYRSDNNVALTSEQVLYTTSTNTSNLLTPVPLAFDFSFTDVERTLRNASIPTMRLATASHISLGKSFVVISQFYTTTPVRSFNWTVFLLLLGIVVFLCVGALLGFAVDRIVDGNTLVQTPEFDYRIFAPRQLLLAHHKLAAPFTRPAMSPYRTYDRVLVLLVHMISTVHFGAYAVYNQEENEKPFGDWTQFARGALAALLVYIPSVPVKMLLSPYPRIDLIRTCVPIAGLAGLLIGAYAAKNPYYLGPAVSFGLACVCLLATYSFEVNAMNWRRTVTQWSTDHRWALRIAGYTVGISVLGIQIAFAIYPSQSWREIQNRAFIITVLSCFVVDMVFFECIRVLGYHVIAIRLCIKNDIDNKTHSSNNALKTEKLQDSDPSVPLTLGKNASPLSSKTLRVPHGSITRHPSIADGVLITGRINSMGTVVAPSFVLKPPPLPMRQAEVDEDAATSSPRGLRENYNLSGDFIKTTSIEIGGGDDAVGNNRNATDHDYEFDIPQDDLDELDEEEEEEAIRSKNRSESSSQDVNESPVPTPMTRAMSSRTSINVPGTAHVLSPRSPRRVTLLDTDTSLPSGSGLPKASPAHHHVQQHPATPRSPPSGQTHTVIASHQTESTQDGKISKPPKDGGGLLSRLRSWVTAKETVPVNQSKGLPSQHTDPYTDQAGQSAPENAYSPRQNPSALSIVERPTDMDDYILNMGDSPVYKKRVSLGASPTQGGRNNSFTPRQQLSKPPPVRPPSFTSILTSRQPVLSGDRSGAAPRINPLTGAFAGSSSSLRSADQRGQSERTRSTRGNRSTSSTSSSTSSTSGTSGTSNEDAGFTNVSRIPRARLSARGGFQSGDAFNSSPPPPPRPPPPPPKSPVMPNFSSAGMTRGPQSGPPGPARGLQHAFAIPRSSERVTRPNFDSFI